LMTISGKEQTNCSSENMGNVIPIRPIINNEW
jgi:hypothetical protein